METEEFSFPRINDTCAHNIDSPPLWNLSPAASPNPYQGIKGEENEFFRAKLVAEAQRKSFSYVENCRKKIGLEEEEDERMDLLWEDLNEELYTTTGSATSSSREVVEFRCVPSLTVANANKGALLPTRNKPGMVVIVKVIKKLFSINNSQGNPEKE
ncbi:uncharacterized protein LOC109804484 [Cajanus cajan]|uniref:Uncharacterized protein n=1 Tax=Cajanus cajan TaxID=3821 RepID=A0A151T4T2_CAJCA|nr:uncharacterized protein LOC109804484 [Cajanus cajan]KYP62067.1 hypothetical protein KK1_016589 [Cajanus cajan]